MIFNNTLDQQASYGGDQGSPYMPGYDFYIDQQQAATDRAKMFLDRINAINLPAFNPMQGIPSQYTSQQRTQQAGGLQPMQMYQNRNQYGDSMQPMQMLNQYRQTGAVADTAAPSQMGQLGTALNRLGGVNTSMGGSTPSIGGK